MVVLFVVGCVSGPPPSSTRWPGHRKQGDQRFTELERRATELEAKISALTKDLADARAQIATLVLAGAPTPAPPPAP